MAVAFRHEAGTYRGADEFVGLTTAFLARAVRTGEPALVLVDADRAERLRAALGDVPTVDYRDIRSVGRNPALVLPTLVDFIEANAGARALWGVGEPLWPERSSFEVAECHQQEALLNAALAAEPTFHLLCPVDAGALAPHIVDASLQCHPWLRDPGGLRANADYRPADPAGLLAEPLSPPPGAAAVFDFTADDLHELRRRVGALAAAVGFAADRADDLVLAVDEVATNTHRHGGGRGTLVTWRSNGWLVCEVRDAGRFTDPMVGRRAPASRQLGGRGLWIANQICDVVQVRSSDDGAVVRMYTRTGT